MQIGRAIASTNSLEKKKRKKSKPTEKYNITPDLEKFHFYKNGNIIKQAKRIQSIISSNINTYFAQCSLTHYNASKNLF